MTLRLPLLAALLLLAQHAHAATATLWFVPPASNATQQGFVRVTNATGTATTVTFHGVDDRGIRSAGTASFQLGPYETKHFNSTDIETGAAAKGLTSSIGTGVGNWRLVLTSPQAIEATALIRTPSGFLTSVQDPDFNKVELSTDFVLPTVNPAENPNQVSILRLVNPNATNTTVFISALDDSGRRYPTSGYINTVLSPQGALHLRSTDLEAGTGGLSAGLGNGTGKWRVSLFASNTIKVLNLMFDPAGYITELPSEGLDPHAVGWYDCDDFNGAIVMSQEIAPRYLGFFGNATAPDSINNRSGVYGSSTSGYSVRNPNGPFGNSSNTLSANNNIAAWPPVVFKGHKKIGYLTTNQTYLDRASIGALDASCSFTATARDEF